MSPTLYLSVADAIGASKPALEDAIRSGVNEAILAMSDSEIRCALFADTSPVKETERLAA